MSDFWSGHHRGLRRILLLPYVICPFGHRRLNQREIIKILIYEFGALGCKCIMIIPDCNHRRRCPGERAIAKGRLILFVMEIIELQEEFAIARKPRWRPFLHKRQPPGVEETELDNAVKVGIRVRAPCSGRVARELMQDGTADAEPKIDHHDALELAVVPLLQLDAQRLPRGHGDLEKHGHKGLERVSGVVAGRAPHFRPPATLPKARATGFCVLAPEPGATEELEKEGADRAVHEVEV